MQLTIDAANVFAPVALAAVHGTTDFELGARRLWPYALAALWPATLPVTPVFLAASTVHFSHDVGAITSIALHATLAGGAAAGHVAAMVNVFSAYFCLVHTPLHYARHASHLRFPLLFTCFVALGLVSCTPPAQITVTDWMQQLVVAHILCDECS